MKNKINESIDAVVCIGLAIVESGVKLNKIDFQGTGFIISTGGLMITCHHVVLPAIKKSDKKKPGIKKKIIALAIRDERTEPIFFDDVEIIAVDPRRDLAVLKTQENVKGCLELSAEKADMGEKIFTLGYPFVKAYRGSENEESRGNIEIIPRASHGIVSAAFSRNNVCHLEVDIFIPPGMSGGPLINVDNGKVVGVSKGHRLISVADIKVSTNFSIGLCSSEIEKFLNANNIHL